MTEDRPVVRCVCFDTTFEQLKALGMRSLEEVQRETQCGTKCGLCVPYILRMLETGETAFKVQNG